MVRACHACAMWLKVDKHGRGTTTGYCTHPSIGRITKGSEACRFYVRGGGAGFDENVALEGFEALQEGAVPAKHDYTAGPSRVPLEVLRERSKKKLEGRIG